MNNNFTDQNSNSQTNEQKSSKFPGLRDVGQADDILNRFRRENPWDAKGIEEMLNDLLEVLLSCQDPLTGSADEFHNFTVSISKICGDNRSALQIAEEGLRAHSNNTDLLGDAILYGRNCGEREECTNWFDKLLTIDKSAWTWRAFSFSIDFLLDEYASKNATAEEILTLVKDYQMYKPDEEDAWLSECDFYCSINNRSKGIESLDAADKRFKFCPKCWLRLADIKMDDGLYDEAEPFIKKLRRNPKSGESVNMSYVFLLDGLCRMTKMMNTDEYENGEYDSKEIERVYKSFRISTSMPGYRDNIRQQIVEQIDRLERETEVEYPYDRP